MKLHNRQIKANFWSDPDLLCELIRDQRMFFIGLTQIAEDSGCFEYDTRAFKILLFPIDNDITPELLKEWTEKIISMGKLIMYQVDEKKYLYLKNFHKHQSLRLPIPSDVPTPPWVTWIQKDERKRYGEYEVNNELLNEYVHGHIHSDVHEDINGHIEPISKVKLSKEKNKDMAKRTSTNVEPFVFEKISSPKDQKEEKTQSSEVKEVIVLSQNNKKEIQEVMKFYNQQFKGLWKEELSLTKEREAHVRARLKNFTVDDLKKAIANLRASPFHCGENEKGAVFATPEFLFRNDSQVDKWLKWITSPMKEDKEKEAEPKNWHEEALNKKL